MVGLKLPPSIGGLEQRAISHIGGGGGGGGGGGEREGGLHSVFCCLSCFYYKNFTKNIKSRTKNNFLNSLKQFSKIDFFFF